MAQKNDIWEDRYDWSMRKKEQEKLQYDKGVKTQYFSLGDFVLLKNSIPYLEKLIEQWCRLFIIDSFGGNHGVSYVLKTLDGELAPNMHYDNYLRIFYPQKGYLRPADEKPFQVTRNLHFRRKKNWNNKGVSYLLYTDCFT